MKLHLFLLFSAIGLLFTCETNAGEMPEKPTLNVSTIDGQSFDLSEQRGNWVIVNFWATWCSPCLKEMPDIAKFVASNKNVKAIGLAFEEIELPDLKKFIEKHPVGYPIALVNLYNPPKDFDTPRGLPTTYLLAPDGKVAKKFMGPITGKELEGAMGVMVNN